MLILIIILILKLKFYSKIKVGDPPPPPPNSLHSENLVKLYTLITYGFVVKFYYQSINSNISLWSPMTFILRSQASDIMLGL